MKKTAIIAGAVLFMFTATVNAQTPDSTKQIPATVPETTVPVTTTSTASGTTVPVSTTTVSTNAPYGADKWNNWDSKTKYAMAPMPEPLTVEKVFPVIGQYNISDKDGAQSQLTVTLDETNKGIAWVEGLPQGRTQIYLRKSPAVYKIPAAKTEDGKELPAGVLIYDKDANTLNVCTGCTYNNDDPASVFLPAPAVEEPVAAPAKKGVKAKKTTVKKVVKPKPVFYTGTKVIAEPAATTAPATTTPAPQQ